MKPYYQDDYVTLYHGDALEVTPDLDADFRAVVTDPPFSSGGRRENARSMRKSLVRSHDDDMWIMGDSMSTAGFTWTMRTLGKMCRARLLEGGHLLFFIDWRMHSNLSVALESADLRQHPTIVWDKTHFGMGTIFRNQHEWVVHFTKGNPLPPARRDVGNVVQASPVRGGEHPTEKPVGLMEKLISVVAPAGSLILDPFAGSGSTLVAARLLGVRSVGVEMDERWCEVIAKRLDDAPLPIHEAPAPPEDQAFDFASL